MIALAAAVSAVSAGARTEGGPDGVRATFEELLRDPSPAQWRALARFDRTLTRPAFADALDRVFDPMHGLESYMRVDDDGCLVYGRPGRRGPPLAYIRFAAASDSAHPPPVSFRSPAAFARAARVAGRLLEGLRVAIEPADIGGRWAGMEDRSVEFKGFGRISEGDLNLVVGRLLRERLTGLGARVFLVRDRAEPVLSVPEGEGLAVAAALLRERPSLWPEALRKDAPAAGSQGPKQLRVAAGLLLTKTLETRARAERARRFFQPDLTIVLQHNATPESTNGGLTRLNRNIFFVDGAFTRSELDDPGCRYRLLLKLFERVTPIETAVAAAVARRFEEVTGFPPVLYGNSANTRLVLANDPYVVARNLAFNRDHDGPVVVTEPYFMNQPETLARLLAGDYAGERLVAGRERVSIFREYADCVAEGIERAYAGR